MSDGGGAQQLVVEQSTPAPAWMAYHGPADKGGPFRGIPGSWFQKKSKNFQSAVASLNQLRRYAVPNVDMVAAIVQNSADEFNTALGDGYMRGSIVSLSLFLSFFRNVTKCAHEENPKFLFLVPPRMHTTLVYSAPTAGILMMGANWLTCRAAGAAAWTQQCHISLRFRDLFSFSLTPL